MTFGAIYRVGILFAFIVVIICIKARSKKPQWIYGQDEIMWEK